MQTAQRSLISCVSPHKSKVLLTLPYLFKLLIFNKSYLKERSFRESERSNSRF